MSNGGAGRSLLRAILAMIVAEAQEVCDCSLMVGPSNGVLVGLPRDEKLCGRSPRMSGES